MFSDATNRNIQEIYTQLLDKNKASGRINHDQLQEQAQNEYDKQAIAPEARKEMVFAFNQARLQKKVLCTCVEELWKQGYPNFKDNGCLTCEDDCLKKLKE